MPIPALRLVSRTRRSHALEHATIHLLNRRLPAARFAGFGTPYGFYLLGHVPTDDLQETVTQALLRLKRGESQLAIHPRCGTNTVTAGTVVGLVLFLATLPGDRRSRRERLPLVILLSTLTLLLVQPLGALVQESITVDADQETTRIAGVERRFLGKIPLHLVRLDYREGR